MKVLVAVKRVIDYNVKIRVKPDNSDVDLTNVKMAMNPFCEIAVEEAVRLKERGVATEIVAVTVGPKAAQEQLRTALALGADRAIHIDTSAEADERVESLGAAKALARLVEEEQPGLTILGKQAIDTDNNQTGQMLAALTGLPQGTFASEVNISGDGGDKKLQVTREVDGGLQTVELTLPAIVTTDLRLNEPRYAKLPDIMKAKKKPLSVTTPAELGISVASRVKLLKVEPPAERQGGIKVGSVDELVDKLKNEAKVVA
ncbi:electron transfer flavoprotein subunit beta [Billgrantia desiderata SP1]|uniref:electron transfer flavoprotein subunit beta/FixA family protein n=1 Tax=Billgrantia desiderata TaxID=52021 RepID=UPI000A364B4C|nr:electron transfer flavoprotein subunit beta/FixA family protein [Halomonas desiderata]OUE37043.1 electron transfer flavoprotein subunit beta [Halomonas desiderata SP1]